VAAGKQPIHTLHSILQAAPFTKRTGERERAFPRDRQSLHDRDKEKNAPLTRDTRERCTSNTHLASRDRGGRRGANGRPTPSQNRNRDVKRETDNREGERLNITKMEKKEQETLVVSTPMPAPVPLPGPGDGNVRKKHIIKLNSKSESSGTSGSPGLGSDLMNAALPPKHGIVSGGEKFKTEISNSRKHRHERSHGRDGGGSRNVERRGGDRFSADGSKLNSNRNRSDRQDTRGGRAQNKGAVSSIRKGPDNASDGSSPTVTFVRKHRGRNNNVMSQSSGQKASLGRRILNLSGRSSGNPPNQEPRLH